MKLLKTTLIIVIIITCSLTLFSCGPSTSSEKGLTKKQESYSKVGANSKGELEIKEKVFITQINDMYYNFNDYKDIIVRVEGMFSKYESPDGENTYPLVYRRGPGCCGNDGWGGFLLDFDKKKIPELKENDWIIVKGRPFMKNLGGLDTLFLKVSDIKVSTRRGKEQVTQ